MQAAKSIRQRARWFVGTCLVVSCLTSPAQVLPPALLVEDQNHSTPLAISTVDVEVRIHGPVAETRMTLVFRNELSRPLAGDLYFPLPVGSTVSGYALDVNGVMVDGVAVDKDRGRQVFETEVRKGVDPGLVEWTRGNHFKTRVFPIPARGTRTVRVSYLSEVQPDERGDRYELPLHFKEKLKNFHLRLEVVSAEDKPVTRQGPLMNLQFSKWREGYVAEARRTNASLVGDLVINLPAVEKQPVLVEKASDGQYYFCASDLPVDPRPKQSKLTLPTLNQLTIFWDASGSRAQTDHRRELDWLRTWFALYTGRSLKVNLVPFRNALDPIQHFVVTNGDASTVLSAISQIAYDGGTQMGCLTNLPAAGPNSAGFLFSDGLGNIGRTEPVALDGPLFIFTADQTVDEPFLEHLARRSGGDVFSLRRLNDQQVLAAMATRPFSFLEAESPAGGVAGLCPQTSRRVSGRFTMVGKLTAPEAALLLKYRAGGKELSRMKLRVARNAAVGGELLRKYWAQKKLAELLVLEKQNQAEIAELGRQYGLVTPFTSLIVLEQVEQYVEHRITPPKSLPKMRAEYARIVEEQDQVAKREEREKTKHLLELWNNRVAWWNKQFKYPEDFKFGESPDAGEPGAAGSRRSRSLGVTPIPPQTVASPQPDNAGDLSPSPALAMNESVSFHMDAATLGGGGRRPEPQPGIAIKEWDPKTPYLQALKRAGSNDAFAVYLTQRKTYGTSPAFYLDCAEFFRRRGQTELAIRVLSNIAELELDNAALLRVLAYRLLQIGQLDLACGLFEEILKLRPEEPQSFRDLALALAQRGLASNNAADCRRALELLARVVNQKWDRFDEIEVVALMELNALWTDCDRRFPDEKLKFPVDARLKKLLDLDVRILLTWDADLTDIDLHITEPSGEVAMYSHNRTTIGGLVSRDFTQGYGPEEYCLRKAMHGSYKIEANYYGSQSVGVMGPVTVQAEVITHFGRPDEQRKSLTLRLEEKKETVVVGEVEF
ncbi:MAG: VIT domain-containing protein [Verrucomicrobiota bacterium]